MPQIIIHQRLALGRLRAPIVGAVAFALIIEAAAEILVGERGQVGFHAVKNAVYIYTGQIGAHIVKAGGGVVAAFAHAAVVHEIAVERRLDDFAFIVKALEFAHRQAVFVGIFLQLEIEMAGLGFFRAAVSFAEIAVQPDFGEAGGRVHPHVFIFGNRNAHMLSQPFGRHAFAASGHKGGQIRRVERRLRAGEVIAAVGVEHFAVILDLISHVFQHALRQFVFAVLKQAQRDEIAVPAIHFVEAPARHHIRARFAALGIVFQGQQAGLVFDAFQVFIG